MLPNFLARPHTCKFSRLESKILFINLFDAILRTSAAQFFSEIPSLPYAYFNTCLFISNRWRPLVGWRRWRSPLSHSPNERGAHTRQRSPPTNLLYLWRVRPPLLRPRARPPPSALSATRGCAPRPATSPPPPIGDFSRPSR